MMQCSMAGCSIKSCCSMLAAFALGTLIGCGGAPTPTPSEFQAGGGENPLDGGVISDDGNTFTFDVGGDDGAASKVDISTSEGDGFVAFRGTSSPSGAAIPSEISTPRGNEFDYDDTSGVARVTTMILGNSASFEFPLDNPFGDTAARTSSQLDGDLCADVRDSMDGFCDFFLANAAAGRDQLIDAATTIAVENVDPALAPLVPGVVSEVINDFYDTLQILCDAWAELRSGEGTSGPVDPCARP